MPRHYKKETIGCSNTKCNHSHVHEFEWECNGNCPEHGPFPLKWQTSGAGPWIRWDKEHGYRLQINWFRYIGPYQTEERQLYYPIPEGPKD